MKKCCVLIIFLLSFLSNAQNSKNVESGLFKINALAPGVSYELGVGTNSTLNFDALVGITVQGSSRSGTSVELFPALSADYRYFYNLDKRLAKGKNIVGNSGNYFSMVNRLIFRAPILGNIEYDSPISYNGALVYGFQRIYRKGFYFGIAGGPGIFTRDNGARPGLFLEGRIGWVLTKRK